MAVDRQRLAEALAYGEQKRRMMESVPTVGNLPPAQPARRSLRTDLENLSSGLGRGIVNQLEGVKGLVTDPVGTVKGAYEGVKGIVRDPSVLADALRYTADKAMSGPLGAGEVVGEMLGPMRGKPPMAEIDVYHGSPHRFEEFDASKIGTGEGAQAFGHGIYLAESPKVAEGYRDRLQRQGKMDSTGQLDLMMEKSLPKVQGGYEIKGVIYPYHKDLIEGISQGLIKKGDIPDDLYNVAKSYTEPGALYTADLPDEMVDRMLDWDKPLSEQRELATPILKELGYLRPNDDGPRQFAQAVKSLDMEYGGFGESGANGMALFKAIYRGLEQGKPKVIDFAKRMNLGDQAMFMEASPLASEVMKRMGIPGIRYLDAGSRGQGGGTRNFVVFPGEEKKVKILERDGEKLANALKATQVEIPRVLYHASPVKGLKELDPKKGVEVPGTTWFSDNPEVAEDYIYPREYGEILYDEPAGEIYEASLAIKNPLVVDFKGEVGDATKLSKLAEKAKKEGYDGLIVRNVDDTVGSTNVLGTSYAVFDKKQINLLKNARK
jgi:hypothetical protein